RWTTRKGQERGGKLFTKTSLHKLLTNVVYIGKIKYKLETHDGEHVGIVDADVWQRVQNNLAPKWSFRWRTGPQQVWRRVERLAPLRSLQPSHGPLDHDQERQPALQILRLQRCPKMRLGVMPF